jgi:thymidylate synthase (FAD)
MKLIKSKFEILESQGLFKDIEIAARTCYKSEDKITNNSAENMVKFLIERNHNAMLEHGTIYLLINDKNYLTLPLQEKYKNNKYSKVKKGSMNESVEEYFITTNYRVLVENNWLDDLQFQCEPTEFHEKRISVKFTCDRGVSHKLKFVA